MVTTRSNWLKRSIVVLVFAFFVTVTVFHSSAGEPSDGTRGYRNPILFSDYSDPDVIREGNHFYMVASTFHFVPGIPILESSDLVRWTILGHALPRLDIDPRYDLSRNDSYAKNV